MTPATKQLRDAAESVRKTGLSALGRLSGREPTNLRFSMALDAMADALAAFDAEQKQHAAKREAGT